MATKVGVHHFTLGEDFGLLLQNIAQEHIIYNYDVPRAVRALADLQGIPQKVMLGVLCGDLVIGMDVKTQEAFVCHYEKLNDSRYSQINFCEWCFKKLEYLNDTAKEIGSGFRHIKSRYSGGIKVTHKLKNLVGFLRDENVGGLLEDLEDNEDYLELSNFIVVCIRFINEGVRIKTCIDALKEMSVYDKENYKWNIVNTDFPSEFVLFKREFDRVLLEDYSAIQVEGDDRNIVDNYIMSAMLIDEQLEKGLEPVDILGNYSAGWLAPNGDFYGLNGEIANMLHNQIASALYDQKLIPESEENEGNPDEWLNNNGWVRIHGDIVSFEGYMIKRKTSGQCEDIELTAEQIDKIYRYGQLCHRGAIRLGVISDKISAVNFRMLAESKSPLLRTRYFQA